MQVNIKYTVKRNLSMGGKSSKEKGKGWERSICSFLGKTLGGSFIRVPNSGSFIGGKNTTRKILLSDGQVRNAKGDIIPPDHLPLLNLEAKNYATIGFHQLIDGCCKQLDAWIDQTEQTADPNDLSFTIFKITRKGSWVVFRKSLAEHFEFQSHVVYVKSGNDFDISYIITDYEKFFQINSKKIIDLASKK
jgi:hypothetical protein